MAQHEGKVTKTTPLSDNTRSFVSIDPSNLAQANVKTIDGTGNQLRDSNTVLIKEGTIINIGRSYEIVVSNEYVATTMLILVSI